jgi:aspartyl-tRNA(Asn)/glutamyl-tRNA(Gln) amidotransferase subunit B
VEIVTEPDVRSPGQAREWLQLLRATLRRLGVSNVNMDEGSLRCDANVSVRPAGSQALGTKTELKNMNSFRFLERGVHAEIARQRALIAAGGTVEQETLHYDPTTDRITSLRSKEEAHDYRYFPEPDLIPIAITPAMLDAAQAAMPELPAARAQRLRASLDLSPESAHQLGFRTDLGDFFEAAVVHTEHAQALANWVTGELVRHLGDGDPADSPLEPPALAALVDLVAAREVTQKAAKEVLEELVATGGDPRAIVADRGLGALGEGDQLAGVVAGAIAANPDAAAKIRAGNAKAIGAIIGAVMRETKGRADGGEVTRLVHEQLAAE